MNKFSPFLTAITGPRFEMPAIRYVPHGEQDAMLWTSLASGREFSASGNGETWYLYVREPGQDHWTFSGDYTWQDYEAFVEMIEDGEWESVWAAQEEANAMGEAAE